MTLKELEEKLRGLYALKTFLIKFKNSSEKEKKKLINDLDKEISYVEERYESEMNKDD
ncbi:MAG: hypothetical protein PUD34_01410 [bacterium]|nr:hypothetical protein [bacterium]